MDDLLDQSMPSRSHLEKMLNATADLGKASGLEAAAKVFFEMANHKRRVVGTTDLKDAGDVLMEKAAEIRERANAVIGKQES